MALFTSNNQFFEQTFSEKDINPKIFRHRLRHILSQNMERGLVIKKTKVLPEIGSVDCQNF